MGMDLTGLLWNLSGLPFGYRFFEPLFLYCFFEAAPRKNDKPKV